MRRIALRRFVQETAASSVLIWRETRASVRDLGPIPWIRFWSSAQTGGKPTQLAVGHHGIPGAIGERHRDDEYHAGFRHRAHARDWILGARCDKGGGVQFQFLSEEVGLFGAISGVVAGLAASSPFQMTLKSKIELSPQRLLFSGVFPAGIGIFFGFYPSRKALG